MSLEFSSSPDFQGQVFDAPIPEQHTGRLARLGRLIGAGLLVAGSMFGLEATDAAIGPGMAHADITYGNLGYPWADAAYVDANYDWGYAACPSSDPGCMSPFSGYLKGTRYGETDPWKYYLRNCTSYVAWKESTEGVKVGALGNGGDWYDNAPSSEQSLAPKPWDAAVAPPTKANPYGHLAFVESVDSIDPANPDNDVLTVTEYNYDGKGDGDTRSGVASAMGFTEFVDFGVHPQTAVAPTPPTADNLFVLQGATLYGKAGLKDEWLVLTNAAQAFQAAGQRVAIIDTRGNLEAKDGLNGPWELESGLVDQYVITPNLLAIRVGGTIYAKAELAAPWTTITTNASSLEAAGGRLAWRDTGGNVWGRDGVQGTSAFETSGAAQYEVTPNLFLVRQDTTLLGKVHLSDQWATLTNGATDVTAAANRIAITDTNGAVEAKDGLGGDWKLETTGAAQYIVTPDLLVVRQGDVVLGKASLTSEWTIMATGIQNVKAAGQRIAAIDNRGEVTAKDEIEGTWVDETPSATSYQIANTE